MMTWWLAIILAVACVAAALFMLSGIVMLGNHYKEWRAR